MRLSRMWKIMQIEEDARHPPDLGFQSRVTNILRGPHNTSTHKKAKLNHRFVIHLKYF